MNLKRIWPPEDNILIIRQALVKIAGNTVKKKLIRPGPHVGALSGPSVLKETLSGQPCQAKQRKLSSTVQPQVQQIT